MTELDKIAIPTVTFNIMTRGITHEGENKEILPKRTRRPGCLSRNIFKKEWYTPPGF